MTVKEKIEQLRLQLHQHNYNYYVLNAPEISDKEFDDLMRELQDLEQEHPEYKDENSPTMRVGSDINKNFTQVAHKYPMLSLSNTYSENEVTDFYDRVRKALNEDFEICCEMKYDAFVRALRKIYKVTLGRKFPMLTNYAVSIPPGGRTDAFVQTVITCSS